MGFWVHVPRGHATAHRPDVGPGRGEQPRGTRPGSGHASNEQSVPLQRERTLLLCYYAYMHVPVTCGN